MDIIRLKFQKLVSYIHINSGIFFFSVSVDIANSISMSKVLSHTTGFASIREIIAYIQYLVVNSFHRNIHNLSTRNYLNKASSNSYTRENVRDVSVRMVT